MQRALELAALGRGSVSPNPIVGCVIVHNDRIIGEGWHQRYGEAHAEVNAVRSVSAADEPLLPHSTIYVTLEPCSHWGKTPPCADLLIEKKVKRVVVCNDDPNPLVAGKGLAKLREAGIEVETGLLAEQGRISNQRFFTFIEKKRPYIILKWAETADGYLAGVNYQPVTISGVLSRRLVHRWRAEEDAIMVGTNTARYDNPQLNVRLWTGRNPVRIVIDKSLSLPHTLHLFDNLQPTLVYTLAEPGQKRISVEPTTMEQSIYGLPPSESEVPPSLNTTNELVSYIKLDGGSPLLQRLIGDLYERRIQSVLVEGGTRLLQSFMEAGLWDELRVFRSPTTLGAGIKAPEVQGQLVNTEEVGDDTLVYFKPISNSDKG